MPPPPAQRASDADRDRTVGLLRDAGADGRLTFEELDERIDAAQRARTLDELAALIADLAGHAAATAAPAPAPARGVAREPVRHRSVLSSHAYPIRGAIADGSVYATTLGSLQIDLREARVEGDAVELELRTVLGSIEVQVPEGVAVEVVGGGVMCSVDVKPGARASQPGAAVVRLRCSGLMGSVTVRSRAKVGEQLMNAARELLRGPRGGPPLPPAPPRP